MLKLTRAVGVAAALALAIFSLERPAFAEPELEAIFPKDDMQPPPAGTKIVGGFPAKRSAWPYQAAIYANGAGCGGTLISPNWVLTAAHCVVDKKSGRTIDPTKKDTIVAVQVDHIRKFYVKDKKLVKPGKFRIVSKVIAHPGYAKNLPRTSNDIALLKLRDPVRGVQAARLAAGPATRNVERPQPNGVVVGWGHTREEGKGSGVLRQVSVPLISNQRCRSGFNGRTRSNITESQICADERGKGSCQGDSGGPLFSRGQDNRYYQVGVTSWGRGCARSPGVYTRVSKYIPWIERQTGLKLPRYDDRPPPPPPPPPVDKDRALIIGIDLYKENRLNLEGSGTDADNMAAMLVNTLGYKPEQIKVLKDSQATRAGILAAMNDWLAAGSKPGGRVFFYYSGHGAFVQDQDGDEADGRDEALIPHDAKATPDGPLNTVIDDEIRAVFARLKDREVTAVIDSCHSGTMTRSMSPTALPQYTRYPVSLMRGARPALRQSVRQAQLSRTFEALDGHVVTWTAVSPSQLALVDAEAPERQGVFTRLFLAGLTEKKADANGDGLVIHSELLDYVTEESAAYCKRNPYGCSLGLTPSLSGPPEIMSRDVITGEAASGALNGGNQADLLIAVEPTSDVPIGGDIRFWVESKKSGHFTLFEAAPDGSVSRILPAPQSYIHEFKIQGGYRVPVPDVTQTGYQMFKVGPPKGEYTLIAVLSEAALDQRALDAALQASGAKAFVDALSAQLRQPTVGGDANVRRSEWSIAEAVYRIR